MPEFDIPAFNDPCFRKQGKRGTFPVVETVPVTGPITDSHCHPQYCADPVYEAARMAWWGVERIIVVYDVAEDDPDTFAIVEGYLEEGYARALTYAAEAGRDAGEIVRPQVRFVVGCHPEHAELWTPALRERVKELLQDPRVLGIGEAGLELHYCPETQSVQEEAFRDQIRLAHETNAPMCLHIREGHAPALRILQEEGFPPGGCVLHCYTADAETLRPWVEAGCYVGFDGPLTFRNADDIRAAAAIVPRDRLMVETDAPFLAPHPMRGMPCGPAHVIFVAAQLGEVLGVAPEELPSLAAQLNENAARLYRW